MKLMFIVEAMGGGVFTYIVDLTNKLLKEYGNKYEVYIAYAVRPQTPIDYKDYFDARIHLIEVKNFTRDIGFMRDLKAVCEIREIAKKIHPDIIHLHSSKAGALGRWAFNGHKILLYYTPHGYSFLMSDYSTWKRILFHGIEAVSAKRCCTTISCSAGEHQETLKLTKRAVYVNNGIDCDEINKCLSGIEKEDHPFTVFTLGRICYQKNPELFNKVAEAMPDIKFLWIGEGELRNKLTAPNIEVTGWMDRKDALKKSVNGDVFMLTSRWEGLPVSLLEAMYLKKPCAVSDVIGNRDVICNGRNGYVCRETEDFVKAVKNARTYKGEQIAEAAFKDIQMKYNTKIMAMKYNQIFAEGLGRDYGFYQ